MKTLAVDTSCLTASVAVSQNGKVLGELTTNLAKTHSQKLLPMIKSLLETLDLEASDIDLFAAAIGPGSFTGLRIGVVTIKGMAYAMNKPVYGVSTLDALAFLSQGFSGIICPVLDARNNQVYTALYKKEGQELIRISDYLGIAINELIPILRDKGQQILLMGDASEMHFSNIVQQLEYDVYQADTSLFSPRAGSVALLSEKRVASGEGLDSFQLEPMYLRKSQAERMRDLCP